MIIGILATFIFSTILRRTYDNPIYKWVISWWLSRITTIVGLHVTITGEHQKTNNLYICNHISWLDVPVLGYAINPLFLAKEELRQAPFIGWLAEKSGTLFISRGQVDASKNAADLIGSRLEAGNKVLIFPEGSRGNGKELGRFFSRLFSSAIDTEVSVQPISISYPFHGKPFNPIISIGKSQNALSHLWQMLGEDSIEVELHYFEPIPSLGETRSSLAKKCETLIRQKLELYKL